MEKLRIGLLIDQKNVDYTTLDILKKIKQKSDLFYEPIIIFEENKYFEKSFLQKIKGLFSLFELKFKIRKISYLILISLVKFVEFRVVKKNFIEFGKIYNLTNENYKKIKLNQLWSKSKFSSTSSYLDIKKLEKNNFDVLIKFGNEVLNKSILKVSKFGILSFNYGDTRTSQEDIYGLLEALNKKRSIGFVIHRHNEEVNYADVIYRGNISANKLWLMNMAKISEKSSVFMIKVLEEIYLNQRLPKIHSLYMYKGKNYTIKNQPNIVFKYILKILVPYILNNLKGKLFGFPLSCWSIAYSKENLGFKGLKNFKEIKNPPGRFFADPFVIDYKNRKIIFVEDYSFKDNKGRISAIDITNDSEEFLGVVLEEDFHLSFPFLFKENDKLYMVPECCNSNQIRLYECIEFPMKWKFKFTLMNSVSAVDTILIKKEEVWFLLTNICSANIKNHSSELHIFYSDKLLSNTWTSIKQTNPVKFDSSEARNGGVIFDKEKIYRVNQVQSPETYGYSLKINLIKKLDKYSYLEETIEEINPNFKKNIIGTHHFNSYKNISVIDFHRRLSPKEVFKNN